MSFLLQDVNAGLNKITYTTTEDNVDGLAICINVIGGFQRSFNLLVSTRDITATSKVDT